MLSVSAMEYGIHVKKVLFLARLTYDFCEYDIQAFKLDYSVSWPVLEKLQWKQHDG